MKAQTQTIEQLSRVLDVAERKVSKTAQRVLGLTAEMVRDPALMLSRNHCRQIGQALGKPDPWASASTPFALSSPRSARRPTLKRDPCAKGELPFGSLPHGLWVHPEVPDGLGGMTPLRQRYLTWSRELTAAAEEHFRALRDDELPEGFADFDRVVVDEVQDRAA